jgi:glucosylceramidase
MLAKFMHNMAISMASTVALFCPVLLRVAPIVWVSSTQDAPSQVMIAPNFTETPAKEPPQIRVVPTKTFQTIDGFGGCSNELGWAALNKLPAAEKNKTMQALFGSDGCTFNLARIPIGASDFATDGYSLDDRPDDYELKRFSIGRDHKLLLPYVKAVM